MSDRRGNLLLEFPKNLQEIAASGGFAPLLAMTPYFSGRNHPMLLDSRDTIIVGNYVFEVYSDETNRIFDRSGGIGLFFYGLQHRTGGPGGRHHAAGI